MLALKKEQVTIEKMDDQSEPVSAEASEGNQDQHKSGAKTERLQTGLKGGDKDPGPDSNSTNWLLINKEKTTRGSEEGGHNGLEQSANKKNLFAFLEKSEKKKQAEFQEKKVPEGPMGEVPSVEGVKEGDEQDSKSRGGK